MTTPDNRMTRRFFTVLFINRVYASIKFYFDRIIWEATICVQYAISRIQAHFRKIPEVDQILFIITCKDFRSLGYKTIERECKGNRDAIKFLEGLQLIEVNEWYKDTGVCKLRVTSKELDIEHIFEDSKKIFIFITQLLREKKESDLPQVASDDFFAMYGTLHLCIEPEVHCSANEDQENDEEDLDAFV